MAQDDQPGRSSERDATSGRADGPTGEGAAFDDVDSRAADLMARLAARSREREQPEPAPEAEPERAPEQPSHDDPAPTFESPADTLPESAADPSPQPDSVQTEAVQPDARQADPPWGVEPVPEPASQPWEQPQEPQAPWEQPQEPQASWEQPREPQPPTREDPHTSQARPDWPDADPVDDAPGSGPPRSGRRMATPPWQQSAPRQQSRPGADPFQSASRHPGDDYADDDSPRGDEQTARPPAPSWPPPTPAPVPPGRSGPPPPPPTPPRWPGPPPWGSSPPPGTSAPGEFDAPRTEEPPRDWLPRPQHRPPSPAGGFGTAGWPDLDDRAEERKAPQFGWRRVLHQATGGRLNPGLSQRDREQQGLLEQIRQPIASDFRIAVLSIKGGVGKTTTTIGLGSALAMVRADRVVAVDANPDRGTLAERVADTSTTSTVRDLLRDQHITRYADVRNHTRMAPSRLEVLASEQDPAVAEVFGEGDYRRTIEILRSFYNIILTDCGTGIMHSSMASVLDMAHTIVLVSSPAMDAARSAAATLDWLSQHGHDRLVRESHVVLSGVRPGTTTPQFERVYQYFEERSGSIHVIPFEPHLAKGADIDFELLAPDTVQAYLELAGAVAEKFPLVR